MFVLAGVATALRQSIGQNSVGLEISSPYMTRQWLRTPPHTDAIKRHLYSNNFYEQLEINFTEFIRFVKVFQKNRRVDMD